MYPEEVEECLKLHPSVADVGGRRASRREVRRGDHTRSSSLDPGADDRRAELDRAREGAPGPLQGAQVGASSIDSVGRAVNGKLDYKALMAVATARLVET